VPQPHADVPETVVFGSFNQHDRISDACLDQWCRVLLRVPEARLQVLDIRDENIRLSLLDRLARRGIDLTRIVTHGRQPIHNYFQAIGNVDIAFDTWPYNGATTTLNTLWMGVPVVALQGTRAISRGSYSIMCSLRMPELIAESADAYVERNVQLAQDPGWRRELRATLRIRLAASPLMDARRFVADLEDGYRKMWRDWCASRVKP
jgi:predicted O-linked N-acetylglucosamine transferase (SPINDLY family)